MNSEKLATWRGKPIEDLSREELIDALNVMARINKEQFESNMRVYDSIKTLKGWK